MTLLHKCWLVQRLGSAIHCNELTDTLHAGDTGSSSRSHQDHLLIISPGTSRFPPSGMGKVDGCTCCVLPDDHLIKKQNNRMIIWSKITIISSNASLLDGRRPFPSLAKGIANHCHVRGDQVWERFKIVLSWSRLTIIIMTIVTMPSWSLLLSFSTYTLDQPPLLTRSTGLAALAPLGNLGIIINIIMNIIMDIIIKITTWTSSLSSSSRNYQKQKWSSKKSSLSVALSSP